MGAAEGVEAAPEFVAAEGAVVGVAAEAGVVGVAEVDEATDTGVPTEFWPPGNVEFVDEELSVRSESEAAEFAICCSDDVCGPSSAKFSVFWGDENCVFFALSISPSPKRSHETLSAGKTAWSFSRISFETFLLRPFSICDILGRGMANLSANCETLSPVLSIKMLRR